MVANRIDKYVVRIPGGVTRSEHRTEQAAHRARDKADRTICPGHEVYAIHADGCTTGPYRTDAHVDSEQRGHARVTWDEEGMCTEVTCDDGWSIADEYWGTLEHWRHGKRQGIADDLSAGEREAILESAGISYDTVWLTDDDVMILVPSDCVAVARKLFDEAAAND